MRTAWLGALALVLVVALGCAPPRPEGDGPLRYRDEVFPTVSVMRDLTYGRAPDTGETPVMLKLDLWEPAWDSAARRPAVVWVHGGGFTSGSKSSGEQWARFFARLGYVAVSIDYRLLSETGCGGQPVPGPQCQAAALAAQHDAQAAVRWLRANADTHRIDRDRIGMAGFSAGAVTSVLAAWRSDDPGTSGHAGHSSAVRGAVSVSGGTPSSEYIGPGDAAVLFIHGTEDRTVPYSWAAGNAGAMFNAGLLVYLHPIEGAGHGLLAQYRPLIHEQSAYFLYQALDLANAGR